MRRPVALLWSGGKDSALALRALRADERFEVRVLLTTMTRDYDRISIHGVRRALLEQQATALGVALHTVEIGAQCTNDQYEAAMGVALARLRAHSIECVAAGDLFLADVRAYREALLARHGLRALFPLWQRQSAPLAREFIAQGFRAVLSCVDTGALAAHFAGRAFDEALLRDLPQSADPCGENGEFHSFVWDGPGFAQPVAWRRGCIVVRQERFAFCELWPAPQRTQSGQVP